MSSGPSKKPSFLSQVPWWVWVFLIAFILGFGFGTKDNKEVAGFQNIVVSNSEIPLGGFLPEITEDLAEKVNGTMEKEVQVKDAHFSITKDQVIFALVVDPSTTKEEAHKLGEEYVRLLSTEVAATDDLLQGPTEDSYGTLFEHFTALITIVVNSDQFVAQGVKPKSSSTISW